MSQSQSRWSDVGVRRATARPLSETASRGVVGAAGSGGRALVVSGKTAPEPGADGEPAARQPARLPPCHQASGPAPGADSRPR
ncbi:hypothetical protein NL676_012950 [Syzygium grande]|nr:hypothetical protein NL676_012950 [Syzygium grande]